MAPKALTPVCAASAEVGRPTIAKAIADIVCTIEMPKSDAPKWRTEHGSNLAEVVVNFSKKVGGGMGLRLRGFWRDQVSERLELQYPRRPTGSMMTALLDASEKELRTVTPEALWTMNNALGRLGFTARSRGSAPVGARRTKPILQCRLRNDLNQEMLRRLR